MIRRHSNLVLVVLAAGCLSDSVEYTPEQDIQAFDDIARAWSAPDGLALSLCEDPTAPGPDPDDTCQIEHVVRADGSAPADREEHGGGCGGCPFSNVAYVRGTLSGTGLTEPVTVTGLIGLGRGAGDDPYEYPYSVDLTCAAPADCGLSGSLDPDGTLTIEYFHGLDVSGTSFTFAPAGQASCN